jgi:hypothetical protein
MAEMIGSMRDLPESVGRSTHVLVQRAAIGGKSQGKQQLRVFGKDTLAYSIQAW